MTRLIRSLFPFTALCAMVLLWGCKDNPSGPGIPADDQAAYRELENRMLEYQLYGAGLADFTTANTMYRSVVEANPGNTKAQFGAGLTELLILYSDNSLSNGKISQALFPSQAGSLNKTMPSTHIKFVVPIYFTQLPVSLMDLWMMFIQMASTASMYPEDLGNLQNHVRSTLLPRLEHALENFKAAEQNPDFEFVMSGKMQGDTALAPLYLDHTEVYLLDGVARGVKALLEQFLVYRYDFPETAAWPLFDALQPENTTFFYRAPDGVTRSQNVLADIKGAADKFQNALVYLRSETDEQNDDYIKIGDTVGSYILTPENIDMYIANMKAVPSLLEQGIPMNYYNPYDGCNYSMVINVSNFFNHPPQNPKRSWFPDYTVTEYTGLQDMAIEKVNVSTNAEKSSVWRMLMWRWKAQDYESFKFPDPSFSGLMVSITNVSTGETDKNENMKRLLDVRSMYWRIKK